MRDSGNHMLTSGPNDFVGRLRVDLFPCTMLIWPQRFNMNFTEMIEHHPSGERSFRTAGSLARSILAGSEEP